MWLDISDIRHWGPEKKMNKENQAVVLVHVGNLLSGFAMRDSSDEVRDL